MAKYYWLKLQADFFETEEVKIIESMPNGFIYSNFYLKLLCKSLKTEGRLMFKNIIPYTPDMLANITGVSVDTVRVALDLFIKLGLMQKLDDGALHMLAVQEMTGAETKWAEYKKKQRLKDKEKKVIENRGNKKTIGQTLDNVHQEIEIEKEIESYHDMTFFKKMFNEFGIDFSRKHEEHVNDLLKKNSKEFVINHFKTQYEILKNNPAVKNIPAVFSRHLFNGTCEAAPNIAQKEAEWEQKKQEEKKEVGRVDKTLEIFKSLSEEKQKEIEEIIISNDANLRQIRKTSEFVFLKTVAPQIRKILENEKLLF